MKDIIEKYFPSIDTLQRERFNKLGDLYADWNEKINLISRKDIANVYVNHILHSLAIAKFLDPVDGTSFIDVGTGGGFPGIPLAILYPECRFHLIDRIKKKIAVVDSLVETLGLKNVTTQAGDLGECHTKFDFAVSRAVMALPELVKIVRKNITTKPSGNRLANGLITLKGGDLEQELSGLGMPYLVEPVDVWFHELFFENKVIVYVPFLVKGKVMGGGCR